jgi:Na+/pantothenate symporter
VIGGLYTKRAGSAAAMAAIAAGVGALLTVRFGFVDDYPWLDPTLTGLVAATAAFAVVTALSVFSSEGHQSKGRVETQG